MKAAHWGVVALGSIAGVAMMAMPAAADGGRGPPPPPYEQGYYPSIWQGLYAGVNAGVGWSGDASGAIGGGQVGYNWRSQQFVYGVEGDIQASDRSEEHTSELQSLRHLVCRLLLEKKNNNKTRTR